VLQGGPSKNSLQIRQAQWDRCLDLRATTFEIKPLSVRYQKPLYFFRGVEPATESSCLSLLLTS